MKKRRGWSTSVRDHLKSWGLSLPAARGRTRLRVGVYLDEEEEKSDREEPHALRLVGWLSQEEGEFVFKYDPGFAQIEGAEPIPAFPDLREVYRSKELWPFFAVRIPPLDREDVREILDRENIQESDEWDLRLLGTLAARSVANRYELILSEAT